MASNTQTTSQPAYLSPNPKHTIEMAEQGVSHPKDLRGNPPEDVTDYPIACYAKKKKSACFVYAMFVMLWALGVLMVSFFLSLSRRKN